VSPAVLLLITGAAFGVLTLLAMRRFSDQDAIRVAKRRARAHLYELRLFSDDPVLALRAQKNLLVWNLRYLRLALIPAAVITIPALLIVAQLDALYGRRALRPGETAVIALQVKPGVALGSMDLTLTAPSTFHVESPPVRIEALRQVCWRVRAAGIGDGTLQIASSGEMVERPIHAGPGTRYVSATCSARFGWVRHGCRLRSQTAESITIDYPEGAVSIAGIHAHWAVWFALFWLAAMLLLRRRFGVVF
jgi:hypothetical protein